jgi:hypothetical protein
MSEDYRQLAAVPLAESAKEQSLPPAWREFIRFCRDLRHGEIERLNIQDGVPVLAEVITRKIRFNRGR